MEKNKPLLKQYGLLGKNINYSFSRKYFADKFEREQIKSCTYNNFDIPNIDGFIKIIKETENLMGLNVTIPYKQEVIPLLDALSIEAQEIGAVNTITLNKEGKTKGYNTDCYGFEESIKPLLQAHHTHALILGTGGASKAVLYVLKNLNIQTTIVSRFKGENTITYEEIDDNCIEKHSIIINCSPVGTSPNTEQFPKLPYSNLGAQHLVYDLIYNPAETVFLKKSKEKGAVTKNGYEMLVLQAEKAWEIWNK
jgi:shikimate dehydrogenase